MEEERRALKAAFPHTIPILTGFLFLGAAYGILMSSKGMGIGWTALMSALVFAGSMQYAAVTLLTGAFHPLQAFLLTLMVNARHLFYGVAMLEKYRSMGWRKAYLIFGMCDETFSINCSTQPPEGVKRQSFYFWVTFFNHLYWVAGSVLGALAGSVLRLDLKGLDFVLTALFVTIFVGQWRNRPSRVPALVGVGCSALALLLWGPDRFLLPAMGLILLVLALLRAGLRREVAE